MRKLLILVSLMMPTIVQAQSPTIEKLKSSGTITIGHRESSTPFAFVDANGKATGYSIDMCDRVVDGLRKQLSLPDLKTRYLPVSAQTRIPLLVNGTVDMECGTTTITLGRRQQVEFSQPIYLTGTRIAVKKDSSIKGAADLAGKTVGFAQGTTDERIVREFAAKRDITNVRAVNFSDQAQGMLALETDRIDAFVADDILLFSLIAKSRNKDAMEVIGEPLSVAPYGIMLRQGDQEFRLAVDRALSDVFKSDNISEQFNKWFKPIGVPMTPQLETLFQLGALQE